MTAVLVSGAPGGVARIADALRRHRADVTEVVELDRMPAVCSAAGPRAFDAYVQLPADFHIEGSTAIERVHDFYADGVLARFPALGAALPSLAPGARVTFVLGHLPVEVATADDRAARWALTRVLAHAARADMPDRRLVVRVLDAGASADEVALTALGRDPARQDLLNRFAELSYPDLRVELMGLAYVET